MPARIRLKHDEHTRAKIQTSQLINRLRDHALGLVKLESTQIKAIEILLNKTLPNLQSIEQKTEITEKRVVSSAPMVLEEWEEDQKKAVNDE